MRDEFSHLIQFLSVQQLQRGIYYQSGDVEADVRCLTPSVLHGFKWTSESSAYYSWTLSTKEWGLSALSTWASSGSHLEEDGKISKMSYVWICWKLKLFQKHYVYHNLALEHVSKSKKIQYIFHSISHRT